MPYPKTIPFDGLVLKDILGYEKGNDDDFHPLKDIFELNLQRENF
jgi:hypothetical protein